MIDFVSMLGVPDLFRQARAALARPMLALQKQFIFIVFRWFFMSRENSEGILELLKHLETILEALEAS